MYYSFFGLSQPPFKITPDTEMFFDGGNRGAILEALIYAISQGEEIYVINPDGMVHYRCDWAFPKNIDRALANREQIDTDEHVQIITAAPWIMKNASWNPCTS